MQTHKNGAPEFIGLVIAILLTLVLQSFFLIPRMLLVALGMEFLWNQASSPEPTQAILFDVLDFMFALFVGRLAMSGTRFIVRGADMASIFLLCAWSILPLSLLTIIPNNIPGIFIPPPADLDFALPGWITGYYFSCRTELQPRLSGGKISVLAAATALIAVILGLTPVHRTEQQSQAFLPHVSATFQAAPGGMSSPPSDSNSSTSAAPAPNAE